MSHLSSDNKIFVIIPAWNEHALVRTVVTDLLPYHYQVVVVDDGSVPSLLNLIYDKPVFYLRHKVNLGQGAALQTGISFALSKGADIIASFDADGQHDPGDLARLVKTVEEQKADLVLGSRFLPGAGHNMTMGRKWLLACARLVNLLFTGTLLTDAHNGLRAMNREAAGKIMIRQNGMAHATEIVAEARKAGLRILEVPVTVHYTEYSMAKGQKASNSFRILFDLFLSKIFR